ncbi:cytochrome C oxidase subunit II [Haladaptatus sp. NG-SE-30]
MNSPLDSPEGNWWNEKVNRRESIWLGISGVWAAVLFGWMVGWRQVGDQNPVGPTKRVTTEQYQEKIAAYKEAATETDGGFIPPGDDVYIGAMRYSWDGLPAVLEAGKTYKFHMGSYDVQHGFSIRKEDTLSKQMSLQVLPGYEWIVEMEFDEPGTYHVVCNEFCGVGHRTMHGKFTVEE